MRFLLLTTLLGSPVALPALAQTAPLPLPLPPSGTRLDIVARGETRQVPDVATIRTGVVTQASTAAVALAENATRIDRVIAALRRAGIADRDIATAQIGLSPQYRYGENQPPIITGYQANNTVSVRFRDVARSGAVLDALVREGANQIDGPNLSLDRPEAALDEARTQAIATARARAELYARAAGLRVVRILSISENLNGDGPVPMPGLVSMVARDAAETKIVAGEQELGVTVSVAFLLD